MSDMLEKQEEMINQLPEPVLSYILQRLAPRCLATSRCVCKPWCTIIDTHCLLRSDLLPFSLAGIFINFHDLYFSEFFSRSSTIPPLSDYLPVGSNFSNHCNGLLLFERRVVNPATQQWVHLPYVVNPATQQWVQLPPPPPPSLHFCSENLNFSQQGYLVFDPTLSAHYEVFLIPHANCSSFKSKVGSIPAIEELEWPLPSCKLHVFSSRTKGWEERSFVREGEAAGTVADMRLDHSYRYRCHNAVYWRRALYVHCQTNFVMRISLLDGKYQVINPPAGIELAQRYPDFYLGKSQKGVYCALNLSSDHYYVYRLDESCGKMGWVLKARISLRHRNKQTERPTKPWTLQDVNYGYCYSRDGFEDGNDEGIRDEDGNDEGTMDEYGNDEGMDGNDEGIMEQKCECSFDSSSVAQIEEWDSNSDSDDIIETKEWDSDTEDWPCITFLGFHPYKEVVFLCEELSRGLAYHLNSSKVQDLGNMCPANYMCMDIQPFIEGSFPYTPWLGKFPEEN